MELLYILPDVCPNMPSRIWEFIGYTCKTASVIFENEKLWKRLYQDEIGTPVGEASIPWRQRFKSAWRLNVWGNVLPHIGVRDFWDSRHIDRYNRLHIGGNVIPGIVRYCHSNTHIVIVVNCNVFSVEKETLSYIDNLPEIIKYGVVTYKDSLFLFALYMDTRLYVNSGLSYKGIVDCTFVANSVLVLTLWGDVMQEPYGDAYNYGEPIARIYGGQTSFVAVARSGKVYFHRSAYALSRILSGMLDPVFYSEVSGRGYFTLQDGSVRSYSLFDDIVGRPEPHLKHVIKLTNTGGLFEI